MHPKSTEPFPGIVFFHRPFPSANSVLVRGKRPVLIDSGFGSDADETQRLLRDNGVDPESLQSVVNTHYHADHAGGNHCLQHRYGVTVAAHPIEAELVNARSDEACQAAWLDQPVEHYRVEQTLQDGDIVDTGNLCLRVVHTPGHTCGHISLFHEASRSLIAGDAVHTDDVAWLNPFGEGAEALDHAYQSLRRLAALKPAWMCSGHGPPTDDPAAAFDAALARYESWKADPARMAWHACKRIFAYRLMIVDGMDRAEIEAYLLQCRWFQDYTSNIFEETPDDFIALFMDEMIRSKAARWEGDRLIAGAPCRPPRPGWQTAPGNPSEWPE